MFISIKRIFCRLRDNLENRLPISFLTVNGKIRRLALLEVKREEKEISVKKVKRYFDPERDSAWEIISQKNNSASEFMDRFN